jgi:GntR family transcriptional regulator
MSGGEPAYVRIAGEIARRIRSGELSAGAQLPSKAELAEAHGVSEVVIRHVIGLLRSQGLVRTVERQGAFVVGPATLVRSAPERQLETAESTFHHEEPGTTQVERDVDRTTATAEVAEALGIPAGSDVVHVATRIAVEDWPVTISDSWEPLDLTRGTPIEDPRDGPEPYNPVGRFATIGYPVDTLEETVSFGPPVNDEHAAYLRTPRGQMVAMIHQEFRSGDRTVQLSHITYAADRYAAYTFRMPLPNPADGDRL